MKIGLSEKLFLDTSKFDVIFMKGLYGEVREDFLV
jgi:hypothetical protein